MRHIHVMKRISIQVMGSRPDYSVEPLEEVSAPWPPAPVARIGDDDGSITTASVGDTAWAEGVDYEDRRHFSTWKEAVRYARSLVKWYKARGDEAWWVDAR